ncbi:DUF3021 family protein [Clostridium beijerinckii]|uniref:DUF3021 family protein n=1 Tax=Clostridium beijerinckii TaxID=1520 RepID=A0A1S8RIP9_CLOBE|nr:DUF3021 family protein [Clostridium beijerinckii]NRY59391.1 hypothetical protein [Clostridium beijerinckii]OOM53062.1 hypothetical protein CLBCK_48220 [Clostridium beijerinckii]
MKRINQYFLGSCIAFTVAIIVTIIMHIMNKQDTINVKSEIFLILIIILINTVLYFMENLQIESQVIHILIEYTMTTIITFLIGIPMKVIEIASIYDVIKNIIIIVLVYGITILSIFISIQNDAEDINRKLSGK